MKRRQWEYINSFEIAFLLNVKGLLFESWGVVEYPVEKYGISGESVALEFEWEVRLEKSESHSYGAGRWKLLEEKGAKDRTGRDLQLEIFVRLSLNNNIK